MDCVPDDDVVRRGPKRTIAWARDATGRRHAKDFLEGGEAPEKHRAALDQAFKVLAEHGRIANEQRFKKESGEIWGFKSYQVRIGAFQEGRVWYLTHGFIKKQNRWPARELKRAKRIRGEHLKRVP